MVLPALREKTLQKLRKKTTKNFECSLAKSEREREKVEKLLKKMFDIVKELFLKNLKHNVRLIEKQVRSIEPSRGLLKFLNKISIDRKLDWINRNSGKNNFGEKKPDFLKTYLKALNITKQMHEYEMKCSPKKKI